MLAFRSAVARCWFVARAIVRDWRKHHLSSQSDASFDLTWEDVEVYWAESSQIAWDTAHAHEPSVLPSYHSGGAPANDRARHPLLNITDIRTWASEPRPVRPHRNGSVAFHIRELRSVPLSELLLNFPAASIHMKPLDVAKLYVYIIAGVTVLHAS